MLLNYPPKKNKQTNKQWNTKMTVFGSLGTIPKGLVKGIVRFGNKRKREDHPDFSIIKIGQNTEKSPGDPRIFALTKTPAINHQLMLV